MMKSYRERRDRERITIQDNYLILGFISSGTYGKVYKAQPRNDTANMVAIKKFKPDREGEVTYTGISQSACREIMLNREILHENVTALQEVMLQDKSIYLVFEYCEHDFLVRLSLHSQSDQSIQETDLPFLRKQQIIHHHSQSRTSIPEGTLKSLLWQLINGVNYLHANWIVHRDLKPANILVTEHGVVKIGDLGLARSFHSPIQSLYASDKVVVTIWYRSPDLLLGARHYTASIDIWSIGCIMGELIYLRPIFKGDEAKPDPHHHHHHHHSNKKNVSGNHSSGVPFQKDQLSKIFDILGLPTIMNNNRTTNTLRQWYISKTTSYRVINQTTPSTTGVGGGGTEGFQLMNELLRYDPTKRVSALAALEHPYFRTSQPLPRPDCYFNHHSSSNSTPSIVNYPPKYPTRRVSPDDSDPKMVPISNRPLLNPLNTTDRNPSSLAPKKSSNHLSSNGLGSNSRPSSSLNVLDSIDFLCPKSTLPTTPLPSRILFDVLTKTPWPKSVQES
ncbi:hypothetical protein PSHT_00387 [Puccinia striiformis]|uniref:Cyclin-dependent kinase 8 n=1 Tax=Puccinia striiformis TaxID=27350 RepID=A0A2S4WN54_9BASI|nr:hypothetical protein PSHT_00387 [Puccinia striiformis]